MAKQIIGLESLLRKLDAMGGKVMDALTNAVYTTTLAAQGDAQRLVPVDTGELKTSITVDVKHDDKKATGTVYTNNPYAIYQEMGTIKMPAQPYMLPAAKQNEDVFQREAEKELLKEIRRMGG